MSLIKHTENLYQSVIPVPEGYSLQKTELLEGGDGPTPDEGYSWTAVIIRLFAAAVKCRFPLTFGNFVFHHTWG